jgi:putative FmdB family regulatory protein
MPTYEYECSKCSHLFEKFQSMLDEPLKKCPACGGKVKRLLGTGAGIIFKGSGFYQTDYRSSAYHSSVKAENSSTKSATPAAASSAAAAGATTTTTTTTPASAATPVASTATPSRKKGRK